MEERVIKIKKSDINMSDMTVSGAVVTLESDDGKYKVTLSFNDEAIELGQIPVSKHNALVWATTWCGKNIDVKFGTSILPDKISRVLQEGDNIANGKVFINFSNNELRIIPQHDCFVKFPRLSWMRVE